MYAKQFLQLFEPSLPLGLCCLAFAGLFERLRPVSLSLKGSKGLPSLQGHPYASLYREHISYNFSRQSDNQELTDVQDLSLDGVLRYQLEDPNGLALTHLSYQKQIINLARPAHPMNSVDCLSFDRRLPPRVTLIRRSFSIEVKQGHSSTYQKHV